MALVTLLKGSTKRYGVRLSQLSTTAAACGGFAAEGPASRRYQSTAAYRCPAAKLSSVTLTAAIEG